MITKLNNLLIRAIEFGYFQILSLGMAYGCYLKQVKEKFVASILSMQMRFRQI
jgi:hypothetical protein